MYNNPLETVRNLFTEHNIDRLKTTDLLAILPVGFLPELRSCGRPSLKGLGRALATKLKPYGWRPCDINTKEGCFKGYRLQDAPPIGTKPDYSRLPKYLYSARWRPTIREGLILRRELDDLRTEVDGLRAELRRSRTEDVPHGS